MESIFPPPPKKCHSLGFGIMIMIIMIKVPDKGRACMPEGLIKA